MARQVTTALRLAAMVEAAAGLALVVAPAVVARLLVGIELPEMALPVSRVAGIGLIGLAVACWPGPPVLGMLIYSAGVALLLSWLGAVAGLTGVLLWPAVVLHGVISIVLARELLATHQ